MLGSRKCHIQIDGGVCPENTKELCRAGADVLVSGSAFFAYPPFDERHKAFQKEAI
jgi:ribulose-phosphate 3-epimerase